MGLRTTQQLGEGHYEGNLPRILHPNVKVGQSIGGFTTSLDIYPSKKILSHLFRKRMGSGSYFLEKELASKSPQGTRD